MCGENLEVYAGIPVKALNAGLFVSRGFGKHPDRIIDSYEIIYVRSGKLDIYEENREYCVEEGQALVLYPGLKHGGLKTYPPDLSFFWVHFYLEKKEADEKDTVLSIPKSVEIARPEVFAEILHRFLNDQERGIKGSSLYNLYVMQILCEMHDSHLTCKSALKPNVLAESAEKFIHTHFHKNLSADMIAKAIGCNADYLGRVYRKTYGITLTDSIHNNRLKHACRQLLNSTKNIDEIAREAGYNDPGYFRRVFKRQKGVSPLKYRKLSGMIHINTE